MYIVTTILYIPSWGVPTTITKPFFAMITQHNWSRIMNATISTKFKNIVKMGNSWKHLCHHLTLPFTNTFTIIRNNFFFLPFPIGLFRSDWMRKFALGWRYQERQLPKRAKMLAQFVTLNCWKFEMEPLQMVAKVSGWSFRTTDKFCWTDYGFCSPYLAYHSHSFVHFKIPVIKHKHYKVLASFLNICQYKSLLINAYYMFLRFYERNINNELPAGMGWQIFTVIRFIVFFFKIQFSHGFCNIANVFRLTFILAVC